jgi:ParB family transcriptional regulator, chromosome partitioning protein
MSTPHYSPLFSADMNAIDASGRLRPVNADRVSALAASMSEIGLQQPIIVRSHPNGANRFQLIAGGHRLAAATELGWTEIAAIRIDVEAASARLIEIDENLIRNELSALDFAVAVAERKRIYEALHPETKHGGTRPKKPADGQVGNLTTWSRFSKDAAKRTGLSEAVFQRASGLMQNLSPEVIALIRSTPLADNAGALKKLARRPASEQIGIARALHDGAAKTIDTAAVAAGFTPPPVKIDPEQKLYAQWRETLSRTNAKERRGLLVELLRHVRTGEAQALANVLAEKLSPTRQKAIVKALAEAVEAHEAVFGEVA